MTNKTEKSLLNKLDELGVNVNLIYEALGKLDNLKVLSDCISENLENITNLKTQPSKNYYDMKLNSIKQLGFVIDDEIELSQQSLTKLLDIIEE